MNRRCRSTQETTASDLCPRERESIPRCLFLSSPRRERKLQRRVFPGRVVEVLVPDRVHVECDDDGRARGADFAVDQNLPSADVLANRRERLLEFRWRHPLRLVERQRDVLDAGVRLLAIPPGVHI
jgi:hypothetical protein